jgi:SAM-dependent methyltransferase
MTDPARRRAIADLYGNPGLVPDAAAVLGRSLAPRPPAMLLEVPGALGLGAGGLVLDAGCREASWAIRLAERYGCRVVGVDLVGTWLPMGLADAATAGLAGRIAMLQGDLEALPVADASCDLVWCRDVLACVGDCRRALAECARVLRPGGGMVLYTVFATELLDRAERDRLVAHGTLSSASLDRPTVEAAIAAARLRVLRRERIASEWLEHELESDPSYLTQDLLEVARLRRDPDRFRAALGADWYEHCLRFALWAVYILLGKLEPVLYALAKPPSRPGRGQGRRRNQAIEAAAPSSSSSAAPAMNQEVSSCFSST